MRLGGRRALLAALAVGLVACGDEQEPPATAAPDRGDAPIDLTIGSLVPLRGELRDFGPAGRKAGELALEEIDSAADEAGADHGVRLLHEDEGADPQAAVDAARGLTEDGATCLTGGWAASSTISVAESVAAPQGVLQLSPASTSDEITTLDDRGLVNRTVPPDSSQGPVLAGVIERELDRAEGTTVNVGARGDTYGTKLSESFRAAWEAAGGVVGEEVVYDPERSSYESVAADLARGDPDAFVVFDFPPTFAELGPALMRTGDFDPSRTFVTDGLASGRLPKEAGERVTDGLRGTAPGVPDEGGPSREFDDLWRGSGPARQTFDAQAFDAVILCYLAAVAAGGASGTEMAAEVRGVSGPPGERYDWTDLPRAVTAIRDGEEIDYEGASGPIDLDGSGDATRGAYELFRYDSGALEVFGEASIEPPPR